MLLAPTKMLLFLIRKILFLPLVVFLCIAVYKFYNGESIDSREYLEPLTFLLGAVIAVWAPLPMIQYFSGKFPVKWQSFIRLILGVCFAGISLGFFIYLLLYFNLFK